MIERAGPAHPFVLAALHATAFPPGDNWSVDMFAAQLGLPGVFGLLDDAGGMLLARVAADEAEILTLGVSPDARRSGIAAALLQEAARLARHAGAAKLLLEVSARNAPALALYRRAGFAQVGRRRRYYADGSDALIMALPLTCAATEES
jgi:ribosomal-protein-alanine N-acetyltransferase